MRVRIFVTTKKNVLMDESVSFADSTGNMESVLNFIVELGSWSLIIISGLTFIIIFGQRCDKKDGKTAFNKSGSYAFCFFILLLGGFGLYIKKKIKIGMGKIKDIGNLPTAKDMPQYSAVYSEVARARNQWLEYVSNYSYVFLLSVVSGLILIRVAEYPLEAGNCKRVGKNSIYEGVERIRLAIAIILIIAGIIPVLWMNKQLSDMETLVKDQSHPFVNNNSTTSTTPLSKWSSRSVKGFTMPYNALYGLAKQLGYASAKEML